MATRAGTARAQAPADGAAPQAVPANPRVALSENFSRAELATIAVVTAAGITMMAAGERLTGVPSPSLGPPAPDSFDRRWADRLHLDDGSGSRFLGRVPDLAGLFVLPYAPAVIYGVDAVAMYRDGAPRLFADRNPDHRLIAYAETLGWTSLITGVVKVLVGRQRPYVVLDHPELAGAAREEGLSFFSAHSAVMFAAASFVALDTSRRLSDRQAADSAKASQWWLDTALPYSLTYGVASLVAVSRIIDQQHWPSDVLIGALVGTLVANLAYRAHFDERGRPRRLPAADAPYQVRLSPTPSGIALVGLFP